MLWAEILREVAPHGRADIVAGFAEALSDLCRTYRIDAAPRQAHFLAQCAHESAGFTAVVEIGGSAYFARYDGRTSLGNVQRGDGARYRGRGLIQLTGRRNYAHYGSLLGIDLIGHPERAAQFPIAAQTASAFWREHGLNAMADRDDLAAITRAINGGLNGLASRRTFLAKAKIALARNGAAPNRARPAAGNTDSEVIACTSTNGSSSPSVS